MRLTLTLSFLLAFFHFGAYPTSPKPLLSNNFSTEKGLSNQNVRCIEQDMYGFLWVGTEDGLNRFDGHSFELFKSDASNRNPLSGSRIHQIVCDRRGNLWIATQRSLNRYDQIHGVIHTYTTENSNVISNEVRRLHLSLADSTLYIQQPIGIDAIDLSNLAVQNIWRVSEEEIMVFPIRRVLSMSICQDGKVWIGTTIGLTVLDRDYTHLQLCPSVLKGFDNYDVSSIHVDPDGNVWLSSIKHGILIISADRDRSYLYIQNQTNNIKFNQVTGIERTNDGVTWIASTSGIAHIDSALYNISDLTFNYFPESDIGRASLHSDIVQALTKDQEDRLWIGTRHGGLDVLDPHRNKIVTLKNLQNGIPIGHYPTTSIIRAKEGNYWVAIDGYGIITLNERFQIEEEYKKGSFLRSQKPLALVEGVDGLIYIGTWDNGVEVYNPKTRTAVNLSLHVIGLGLPTERIFSMKEDSQGNIWIGTWYSGLHKYNPRTRRVTVYPFKYEIHPEAMGHIVTCILSDSNENIWYGTEISGLFYVDPEDGNVKKFDLPDDGTDESHTINSIHQDKYGTVWVATGGNGLHSINPNHTYKKGFSISDGLPSNAILGIVEDIDQRIWLTTTNGIASFDPVKSSPVFKNYNTNDGFLNSSYLRWAYLGSDNGYLLLAGQKGIDIFNPHHLIENPNRVEVRFTNLKLFNDPIEPGDSTGILSSSLNHTQKLHLDYDQNHITFGFTGIDFSTPKKVSYRYMLEGYSNQWIDLGNSTEVTFTSLKPGQYVLHVMGTNNLERWDSPHSSMAFAIAPPFWQTLWFQAILVALLLTLIYLVIRIRMKSVQAINDKLERTVCERTQQLSEAIVRERESQEEIQKQNEELLRHRELLEDLVTERTHELQSAKDKAEESDKVKTTFLANMSHEIRTPMNAIMGFISLLKSPDYSNDEKDEFLKNIEESSHALLRLINDILDISLLESGGLRVIERATNISIIFSELEQYFQVLSTKKVTVSFLNEDEVDALWLNVDALRFRQIFNNIIDNAVKYTEEGSVRFGYQVEEGHIRFFVSDTGPGIPPENHEAIFLRFQKFDIPMARMYPGTGIGLTICRSLVEMLNGTINVESSVGKGTTFSVSIPTNRLVKISESQKDKEVKNNARENLSGLEILIAEDEPANYEYIKQILKPTKAKVYYVEDGEAAVKFARGYSESKRLIILMDIRMPKLNGMEAATQIKKINPNTIILAQTAQTPQTLQNNVDLSMFDDYLIKPIQSLKLLRAIDRLLR